MLTNVQGEHPGLVLWPADPRDAAPQATCAPKLLQGDASPEQPCASKLLCRQAVSSCFASMLPPFAENYMNISHQTLEVMRFAAADPAVTHVLKVGGGARRLACCWAALASCARIAAHVANTRRCSCPVGTHLNFTCMALLVAGAWGKQESHSRLALVLPLLPRWTTIRTCTLTACCTASTRCPGAAACLCLSALTSAQWHGCAGCLHQSAPIPAQRHVWCGCALHEQPCSCTLPLPCFFPAHLRAETASGCSGGASSSWPASRSATPTTSGACGNRRGCCLPFWARCPAAASVDALQGTHRAVPMGSCLPLCTGPSPADCVLCLQTVYCGCRLCIVSAACAGT